MALHFWLISGSGPAETAGIRHFHSESDANTVQVELDRHRSINALAETINGLYKTEVIRRQGAWRSLEAVELATLTWVDWFNHRRLLEPIGFVPPAEAEPAFYAKLENTAVAA